MNHVAIPRVVANRLTLAFAARGLVIAALFLGTVYLGGLVMAPVTLDFPDFPLGVAVVDLGQTLTVQIDSQHDGGKGVTWTCSGDACTKLTTTSQWATFYAAGITGTANITATSIRQPSIRKVLKVTVNLNEVPDMLCQASRPLPTRS